jgi:hypothetical protein
VRPTRRGRQSGVRRRECAYRRSCPAHEPGHCGGQTRRRDSHRGDGDVRGDRALGRGHRQQRAAPRGSASERSARRAERVEPGPRGVLLGAASSDRVLRRRRGAGRLRGCPRVARPDARRVVCRGLRRARGRLPPGPGVVPQGDTPAERRGTGPGARVARVGADDIRPHHAGGLRRGRRRPPAT